MKTVGQVLRDARLKKGVSLDEIACVTRIKRQYLLALEKGEYRKLPGIAYIKGFIKNYGEYVGLVPDKLWVLFRREFNENQETLLIPRPKNLRHPLWKITPNQAVALVVVFAATLFFFYLIRGVFSGPPVKIYSPPDNFVADSLSVKVSGQTETEAKLTINDQPVALKEGGRFEVTIQLSLGPNDIVIVSTNKLGRKTQITRTVSVVPRE